MGVAAKAPSDTASRVRFALTQVVLGIDLSRSAVPTHSSPAVVSTEPAPRKPSRRRQHEIQNVDLYFGYNSVRCAGDPGSAGRTAHPIQTRRYRNVRRACKLCESRALDGKSRPGKQ